MADVHCGRFAVVLAVIFTEISSTEGTGPLDELTPHAPVPVAIKLPKTLNFASPLVIEILLPEDRDGTRQI
jgi:hypothetical protein